MYVSTISTHKKGSWQYWLNIVTNVSRTTLAYGTEKYEQVYIFPTNPEWTLGSLDEYCIDKNFFLSIVSAVYFQEPCTNNTLVRSVAVISMKIFFVFRVMRVWSPEGREREFLNSQLSYHSLTSYFMNHPATSTSQF